MKYKVYKQKGHVIRRMSGDYIKDLARLHKFAPCTIEQEADIPDDENNKTTIIRLDPPATNRKRPRKFRFRVLFGLAVALLTASCGKTPANSKIADLETGQSCDPSEMSDKSYSSDTSDTSDQSPDTTIDLTDDWEACYKLAHAFAVVESNNNPHAVNHRENAVGLLQIRPIMVEQANQIVGEDIYELSDREDSLVSLGIFHTIMSELNPTLDVDKAIDIWNPNASNEYRNLVKAIYHE
ncbi:MAG: transglycosylase SLT domain-containing protein [Bacteroidales bacterium]|nr:transglycosylase SLT domain-containing protein [Bacteroidales bacterium]